VGCLGFLPELCPERGSPAGLVNPCDKPTRRSGSLGVADLTDVDVREMARFLAGACTEFKRWLPEPEWRPGWQSEAAVERANQECGPGGPWGDGPVTRQIISGKLLLVFNF
jgi:hypothetical protein